MKATGTSAGGTGSLSPIPIPGFSGQSGQGPDQTADIRAGETAFSSRKTTPRQPDLTSVKLQATVSSVKIRNFVHKGLKRLYAEDSARGVPPDTVDKLRKMLAFLDDMQDPEELRSLPAWKVHTLTGDRKGTWSLTVTRNRRLTFRIDIAERELCDLNLEDYH